MMFSTNKNICFYLFSLILSSPFFLFLKNISVRACLFSNNGNLPQVEFAYQAAHRSTSTVIAVRNNETCIAIIYHPLQFGI